MIAIAAAGNSSRFKREGFEKTKIMLPLGPATVFDFVLKSFESYFKTQDFVVITKNNKEHIDFVTAALNRHGIARFEVIGNGEAKGMMPDIYHGICKTNFSLDQPLLIHVADVFRPNFSMPSENSRFLTADFERPLAKDADLWSLFKVLRKCKGLGAYHLPSVRDFVEIYEKSACPKLKDMFGEKAMELIEGYRLIRQATQNGNPFQARLISDGKFIHCGKPRDYRSLQAAIELSQGLSLR